MTAFACLKFAWRYARLAGALLTLPLAVWACTAHPLEAPQALPDQQTDDYYAVNPIRDIDLLFVIDNSGSTSNKQRNFTQNFPNFIRALEMIPGGLPNVRIAVVSSDVGAGNAMTQSCHPGGDLAKFVTTDVATGVSCGIAGADQWITPTNLMPGATIEQSFTCMATRASNGCGFEHQLRAMDVALHPRQDWNPMNAGFLRPDAYLGIIILTDEDDCSGGDDAGPFFMGPAPAGVADNSLCAEAGTLCNNAPPPGMPFDVPLSACQANPSPPPASLLPVKTFIDDIKGLKPGHEEKIVVAAIAGWPLPGDEAAARYTMVPLRLGTFDVGQVCRAGGGGTPALRIKAFLDAFTHNTLQSICQNSYAMALTTIGNLVGAVVGNPCISAPIVDTDSKTPGLQADCVVEDRVGTTSTPLPQCANGGPRPCWSLSPAANCQASGFQIAVDRGNQMAPAGVQQLIKCRTCTKANDARCAH